MAETKQDAVPGMGVLLSAARSRAGLTQADITRASGVSPANQSLYENDLKTPRVAVLLRLAAAYGVDVCELIPKQAAPAPVLTAPRVISKRK